MTDPGPWGQTFDEDNDWGPPKSCPECGEPGACAYDTEGRPLIHSMNVTAFQVEDDYGIGDR